MGGPYCYRNRLCVECGGALKGRQQRWCGQRCVDAYMIRAWPTHARRKVYQRDHGRCTLCGLDTVALVHDILRTVRTEVPSYRTLRVKNMLRAHGMQTHWKRFLFRRPTLFDVDHVIGVAQGGGECGLENLRTLCLRCHAQRTREQRRCARVVVRIRRVRDNS